MKRSLISNGNPMESLVGFSRAVRVGPYISVGGTAPADADGKTVIDVRAEYFKDIRPVDTIMQVSRFVNPEWLVEFEVDAVVSSQDPTVTLGPS